MSITADTIHPIEKDRRKTTERTHCPLGVTSLHNRLELLIQICKQVLYRVLLYNSEPTRQTFVQNVIRDLASTPPSNLVEL